MITESSEVPRFCGISDAHRAYPAAGGLGILVGDRQLPHPGVESIVESYYRFLIGPWQLTSRSHLKKPPNSTPRLECSSSSSAAPLKSSS
jgi:hypothetical protein